MVAVPSVTARMIRDGPGGSVAVQEGTETGLVPVQAALAAQAVRVGAESDPFVAVAQEAVEVGD